MSMAALVGGRPAVGGVAASCMASLRSGRLGGPKTLVLAPPEESSKWGSIGSRGAVKGAN
jgi:hypothetical protein